MSEKSFKWLHLSDLHAGMGGHGWMWPTLKSRFFEDLAKVYDKSGAWDVVIFSGDLSQKGAAAEYGQVTTALLEIWEVLDRLGFSPKFAALAGNHDLLRPDPTDATAIALGDWWSKPQVSSADLSDPKNQYRLFLEESFKGFLSWKMDAAGAGLPFANETPGLLPGDFSTTIETDAGRLGVVGLNSAWLQLGGGEFRGKLNVLPQQLLAVTGSDPDAWCSARDRNLLVSHHPVDWLHPKAQSGWRSEINTPHRFDAHLYGHMHQMDATSELRGGSAPRRSIQAASIFGLEMVHGDLERTHGYSVAQLGRDGQLRVWPRIAQKMQTGAFKMVPDQSLDLDDTQSFTLPGVAEIMHADGLLAHRDPSGALVLGTSEQNEAAAKALETLRHYIPGQHAHAGVRLVEQRQAGAALAADRALWLSAELAAGVDGFIKSIVVLAGAMPIYRLDLVDYTTREDYFDEVKASFGVTFQELCTALAAKGPATLILGSAPTTTGVAASGKLSVEADIEVLVDAALTYCPELKIIIQSLRPPSAAGYASVELKPLEEADVQTYLLAHEKGGHRYADAETVGLVFRHADGFPTLIDATLNELELVTPEELSSTNRDLTPVAEQPAHDLPAPLRILIDDLAATTDPERQRAYNLLKALASFPYGESLARIRRFYNAHGIAPFHARELVDNALVVGVTAAGAQVGGKTESERLLIVPRPVRDYVRASLTRAEQRELSSAAATIYFGENWAIGKLKATIAKHYMGSTGLAYEPANANALVFRLLNEALDGKDDRGVEASLELAKAYVTALFKGDHFRHVVRLSRDILARLPEERDDLNAFFTYQLGRSLRMLGDNLEAQKILATVVDAHFPPPMKQSLLISRSLASQKIGDLDEAAALSMEILKINKASVQALQAKAILLEVDPNTTPSDFRALEQVCRKRGALVAANNLALNRAARASTDSSEAQIAFDEIIKAKGGQDDFYNRARAIYGKVRVMIANNEIVSEQDQRLLFDAYGFLYNERLSGPFDACHDVLWDLFVLNDDQANLLRLFRHSSLIWRLRGDDRREQKYLAKLARYAQAILSNRDGLSLMRETAYYLVRASRSQPHSDPELLT